ncbi:hypothetical protein EVG20_g4915, partial [Dentipellis fragilis]
MASLQAEIISPRTPPRQGQSLPGLLTRNQSTPVDLNRLSIHRLNSNAKYTIPAIRGKLKSALMDNLREGVSIQDFIQHVYGFKRASLRLGRWTYSHREDLRKEYISSAKEPGRYKPFCDLFEYAYAQLSDHTELPKHCNLRLRPLGSTQVLSDYNYRKPDVVVIGEGVEPYESGDKLSFKDIPLCMEFKKDPKPS